MRTPLCFPGHPLPHFLLHYSRFIGTFLVRVSENRFGYTLSYRVADRCRHYMIEQDTRGRYALRGADKVCSSLNELIEWFTRHRINAEGDMLREPCGQEVRSLHATVVGTVKARSERDEGPESCCCAKTQQHQLALCCALETLPVSFSSGAFPLLFDSLSACFSYSDQRANRRDGVQLW